MWWFIGHSGLKYLTIGYRPIYSNMYPCCFQVFATEDLSECMEVSSEEMPCHYRNRIYDRAPLSMPRIVPPINIYWVVGGNEGDRSDDVYNVFSNSDVTQVRYCTIIL